MPPEPGEYQGGEAIARFLRDCEARRGTSCGSCRRGRTGQPAFGCYLPDLQAAIARAYGLMVLTLTADRISAITLMRERSLLPHFGLPQRFPRRRRVIAAEGGARPLYVGGWASAGEESVRLQRLPVHFVRRRCLNEYLENDHQDDAWKRAATR
jgi:hypothetical protein